MVAGLLAVLRRVGGYEINARRYVLAAAVAVMIFQLYRVRHSPRDMLFILVLLAAASIFYMGMHDMFPGTLVGWVLFVAAILLFILFPDRNETSESGKHPNR